MITLDEIVKLITGYTLLGRKKQEALYNNILNILELPGDIAEVGVYKGGSSLLLALAAPNKIIHAFDTFMGLPVPTKVDSHKEGEFIASFESVRAYLSQVNNIKIYPGKFPDSGNVIKNNKFCFVHVDVDLYAETLECLKFFYPRLVSNGIMIIDDYNWGRCKGVNKAIEEYFIDKKQEVKEINGNKQAIIIK